MIDNNQYSYLIVWKADYYSELGHSEYHHNLGCSSLKK